MTARIKLGALAISWCLAAVIGSALALGGRALSTAGSTGASVVRDGLIEAAYADTGKGDYLFLPNRLSMWVINRINGKIIHYQFYDNQVGTVERSRISSINLEWFPLRDTDFLLSDRNLTSFMWVVNRVTGNFQVWRANRDGILSTDQWPVPAGEDMQGEAMPPSIRDERSGFSPTRRAPATPEESPASEPAKRRPDVRPPRARNS